VANVTLPGLEHLNLVRIDVESDDGKALAGKRVGERQSNVAQADDGHTGSAFFQSLHQVVKMRILGHYVLFRKNRAFGRINPREPSEEGKQAAGCSPIKVRNQVRFVNTAAAFHESLDPLPPPGTIMSKEATMNESCDVPGGNLTVSPSRFPDPALDVPASSDEQVAVFAGGCFWCVEAVFRQLNGVRAVTSGYSGGSAETADYQTVCGGATDHAEAVSIHFDSAKISFGQLLKVFFSVAHDPTQLNRQGADHGRQYRSAIFYANDEQKRIAEAYMQQLNAAGVFKRPIVTRLEPLADFYAAEAYHQDYAAKHPDQGYIAFTAAPKVEKVRTYFADRLAQG
jgi:peptide-methionine (S)-S-oxide reductase